MRYTLYATAALCPISTKFVCDTCVIIFRYSAIARRYRDRRYNTILLLSLWAFRDELCRRRLSKNITIQCYK